jgi:hypothetical protein
MNSCTSSRSRRVAARAVEAIIAFRHARRWLCSAHRVNGVNIGPTKWFMVVSWLPEKLFVLRTRP